ncbi:MAG: apolipoprotein N-acyltransferase [Chlamydiales bacterium]
MLILLSFLITAFGQPAWIHGCGALSAAFGFALFWKGMFHFARTRDRFLLAVLWFAAVQGVQLSWMATVDYMGPFILLVYLFLILAMGLQFGLLSLFIDPALSWRRGLAFCGAWVIFEWLRLFFLCGFSWNPVGLALADSPYSIQFASVWGIFGLSFWVMLVNVSALKALIAKSIKQVALWASLAFFPYLFGMVHQSWIEAHIQPSKILHVALIDTNLSPDQKELDMAPLAQWEGVLRALKDKGVDLIILPEGAFPLGAHTPSYPLSSVKKILDPVHFPQIRAPFALFEEGGWRVSNAFMLQTLSNRHQAHVIVGLDDHDFYGHYNAAFHFQPGNAPFERYEKQILVPIGEYIPFGLARFAAKHFGITHSFDRGTEGKIFAAGVPIGISICVEETFPSLIRNLRLKGAALLVNVTNDAWFPRSKLGRQHFDHGRVRSVENGVPILRACNAGLSAGIDCFGRPMTISEGGGGEASALHFPFPIRSYSTLYTWWGDGAILGISLGAFASYFLIRKKKLL